MIFRLKYYRCFVPTIPLLILSSCSVGPEYVKPDIVNPTNYGQPTPQTKIEAPHWVDIYENEQLSELVKQAANHNYNLKALYERTRQARALIRRSRADRNPQIDASGNYQRFEDSEQLDFSRPSNENYNVAVTFGWEIDLFGRVARLIEAAEADANAAQSSYEDLLLLTETDVAISYFRLRALEREIDAVKRSVETRQESLDIVMARFESGTVSNLDVAQSETLLADSEADFAALKRERDLRRHALAVLTGQPAPMFKLTTNALTDSPVDVPVGVPSDLLLRRPDIRQAEFELIAANARVGIATANFFPRITISSDAGFAALDASDWFKTSAGFYTVGPQINLPIFQGGRLRAELTRSEAAYAESLALYQQTIIEAFAEVEDALSGWRLLSDQRAALGRAVTASQQAQKISNEQYASGLIDFISALDSERTALNAERRLARVVGDEYENSIRLIRAVGGSW